MKGYLRKLGEEVLSFFLEFIPYEKLESIETKIAADPQAILNLSDKLPQSILNIYFRSSIRRKVIEWAKRSVKEVDAYRNFLAKKGIEPKKVYRGIYFRYDYLENLPFFRYLLKFMRKRSDMLRGEVEFSELPILTKENYVIRYDVQKRIRKGMKVFKIVESSGFFGKPTRWPRSKKEWEYLAKRSIYGMLFAMRNYGIKLRKGNFSVLNCFGKGWIAYDTFDFATRELRRRKSLWSGPNPERMLEYLLKLLEDEQDVIIIGAYPPNLVQMIELAKKNRVDLKKEIGKRRVAALVGGEGMTAESVYKIRKESGIVCVRAYGLADVRPNVAVSTPTTDFIQLVLERYKGIRKKLLGSDEFIPIFVGLYDSMNIYLETLKGRIYCGKEYVGKVNLLIFTNVSPYQISPMPRYCPFDSGIVLAQEKVKEVFKKYGIKLKFEQPLDLVFVFGRADGTLILAGANVYRQQIELALINSSILEKIDPTSLRVRKREEKGRERLEVSFCSEIVIERELNRLAEDFDRELRKLSGEYDDARRNKAVDSPVFYLIKEREKLEKFRKIRYLENPIKLRVEI